MGNLTMNIKERLAQAIEKQRIVAYEPVSIVKLCRDALAEIERLEKITGVGVSLEMYETVGRERDAARRQLDAIWRSQGEATALAVGPHWVTLALWDGRETYGPAVLVRFEKIVAVETVYDEKTASLQRSKLHLQGGGTLLVLESPAYICGMAL